MTVTLVGSRAMRTWYADAREPKDWDFITDGTYRPGSLDQFAIDRPDVFTDERLGAWQWGKVATPAELYTLKISHSFWEINHSAANWNKHAGDIMFLAGQPEVALIRPLYDLLLPIWKDKYDRTRISTHKSKDEFFADNVDRKYDHDSLHESVAYGDTPLYVRVLRDGADVAVDNAKFRAMDHETQIRLVREEIYATALERILVPGNYSGSPGAAYWWALRRTATSLFQGEWALFLMLNLTELRKPDCDYMQRHLDNQHKLRLNGEVSV